MQSLLFGLAAIVLLAAQNAVAHDNATLDAMQAPHGGQLRMAGPYHLELVAKANEISVYITDHAGTKIPAMGATGSATIMSGSSKVSIPLRAVGDNRVAGSGTFGLAPDMSVTVSVGIAGRTPETARFTPMQKMAASLHHGMH